MLETHAFESDWDDDDDSYERYDDDDDDWDFSGGDLVMMILMGAAGESRIVYLNFFKIILRSCKTCRIPIGIN